MCEHHDDHGSHSHAPGHGEHKQTLAERNRAAHDFWRKLDEERTDAAAKKAARGSVLDQLKRFCKLTPPSPSA